jgi:hypothetical protein
VLLLKSLFCLTGSDNRLRFIAIHLICYFLFTVFSSVLSFSSLLSFFALLFFVSVSTLSTKRRLNDADLNINWLIAPAGSFLIAGLIILMSGYNASYWLLTFPLVISTFLMTYKSQKSNHILGYCGIVDLSSYVRSKSTNHEKRIEPTFNNTDVEHSQSSNYQDDNYTFAQRNDVSTNSNFKSDYDIGESIRLKLFNNKNAVLTILILTLLVIMAMFLTSILSSSNKDEDENTTQQNNEIVNDTQPKSTLLHEVTLPDNFSLLVSSFNGIIIRWEGDTTDNPFIWQQLTAQGDESCKVITYNNGEMIRTLTVTHENNGDYFAKFSPLDTKVLIRNLAIRSSFTLCGYKFSLKGSQSTLGKHSYYSKFIVD